MLNSNGLECPTVAAIRREYHISIEALADEAGVARWIVYISGIGGVIEEEDARKILAALSRLTARRYDLTNVSIQTRKAIPQPEQVFLRRMQQRRKEVLRGKITRI